MWAGDGRSAGRHLGLDCVPLVKLLGVMVVLKTRQKEQTMCLWALLTCKHRRVRRLTRSLARRFRQIRR